MPARNESPPGLDRAPIRIAVIGLGSIAQNVHLRNLRELADRFEVRRLCDVSQGVAAAIADGLPGRPAVCDDVAEVCTDPTIEAVLVLSGGPHGAIVRSLLEAGKHVFCEKPLGISLAEIARLRELAADRGLVCQIGYMKSADPTTVAARSRLEELGDLRLVRVTVLHPNDERQLDFDRILRAPVTNPRAIDDGVAYEQERLREALGDAPEGLVRYYNDVLLGSVVHQIAVFRALGVALPTEVADAAVSAATLARPLPAPPDLFVRATSPSGVGISLDWVWTPELPEYREWIDLVGTHGSMRLDLSAPYEFGQRSRLRQLSSAPDGTTLTTTTVGRRTGFLQELIGFADAVSLGGPEISSVDGAFEDTRMLQAIVRRIAEAMALSLGGEAADDGR